MVNEAARPAVAKLNPIPLAVLLDAHFHDGRTKTLTGEFERCCPADLTSIVYSPVSRIPGHKASELTPVGECQSGSDIRQIRIDRALTAMTIVM